MKHRIGYITMGLDVRAAVELALKGRNEPLQLGAIFDVLHLMRLYPTRNFVQRELWDMEHEGLIRQVGRGGNYQWVWNYPLKDYVQTELPGID
jgi:hypothetical protein